MDEKEAIDYIPTKFEQIARKIWGDHIVDQMEIRYEVDPKRVGLAGIASVRNTFSPHKRCAFYKTNIFIANPLFFTYDKKAIDAILIHEAVHLGIHCHNERFRQMCLEHGSSLTRNHLESKKIKLQIKKGSRFVDFEYNGKVPTFDTLDEAREYGKTYLCLYPKERLRAFY